MLFNLDFTLTSKLTVHVGVSRRDSVITLEQYASNGKYESVDNENCLPNYACCVLGGAETLCSGLITCVKLDFY